MDKEQGEQGKIMEGPRLGSQGKARFKIKGDTWGPEFKGIPR